MGKQKSLSARARLRERVERNVIRGIGITNETVYRFCKMSCGSKFRGVFPSNLIPTQMAIRAHFTCIINLSPRPHPNSDTDTEGHFVAICADPASVYYLDSYGLPCTNTKVIKFLNLCRRPVFYNVKKIQHVDSAFCSFYAMLFVLYFDTPNPPFRLRFAKTNLRRNDLLCKKYIERIIRS